MIGLIEEYASRLKTRKSANFSEVWDPYRKKWVLLGPEEFVRQVMLAVWEGQGRFNQLIPIVEKAIIHEGRNLRFDAVLMKGLEIWVIIEFKSPTETLSEAHILQLARYNVSLNAPYLILSNGIESRFFKRLSSEYQQLSGWEEVVIE